MNSWSFSNLWALIQLAMMLYHRRNHLKFYSWFNSANSLSDSSIRGLSTRGYPMFGIITVPKLSNFNFKCSLHLYYLTLLFLIFDHSDSLLWTMPYAARVWTNMTTLSCLLWVCISGSLWAEESLSYHREVLATIVHIYLMLWPSSFSTAQFGFHKIVQCHLASIYFAGANQKLFCSLFQLNPSGLWPLFSPPSFVWLGSWCHYPQFLHLKRLLLRHPWVLGLPLGLATLALEWLVLPYILFIASSSYDPEEKLLPIFFFLLISFHLGVLLLQGIDYFSFWSPALIIFLYQDSQHNWSLVSPWNTDLTTGEFTSVLLIYAFLLSQIIFSLICAESFNINLPPLMSCPMFVTINTMFGPSWNNLTIFIEKEGNCSGQKIDYPQLEWQYPTIHSSSGISLDISSINYFSTNHETLNKDFIICGLYDENQPPTMSLSMFGKFDKYFLSSKQIEKTLSLCPFSKFKYYEEKIFYFVSNRDKYLNDDIFEELAIFLKFSYKTEKCAQLYSSEAVEKSFNFQDKMFRSLQAIV